MTAVKIMQRPARFLNKKPPPDLRAGQTQMMSLDLVPKSSRWHELFDGSDSKHHRVGSAYIVAIKKIMEAATRERLGHPPPTLRRHIESETKRFDDHLEHELSENEINTFFYPWLNWDAWEVWLELERNNAHAKLYYMVFQDVHQAGYRLD